MPDQYWAQLILRLGYISLRLDNTAHKVLLANQIKRLEGIIREALAAEDHERIAKIVSQLCQDYAYAVHQPHARNGGLIGLAAAAIALGGVCAESPAEQRSSLTRIRKLLGISGK